MKTTSEIAYPETRLAELETQIDCGAQSVHEAIVEIHSYDLWKDGQYDSFWHYCETRWGMSKAHAYRMLAQGRVLSNIAETLTPESPIGDSLPLESHCRQLSQLHPTEQVEAWSEAVQSADGKPTASDVRRAVQSRQPNKPQPTFDMQLDDAIRLLDRPLRLVGQVAAKAEITVPGPIMDAFNTVRQEIAKLKAELSTRL